MRKTTILTLILLIPALSGCKKTDTDIRDIFIGNYNVIETWTENSKAMSKPPFAMSVEKAFQNSDMVLLNNFANYGAGTTAEASVSRYILTIPQQTLPNLKAISGTGNTNGVTMTYTYTEIFNGISIDVTVTANKK